MIKIFFKQYVAKFFLHVFGREQSVGFFQRLFFGVFFQFLGFVIWKLGIFVSTFLLIRILGEVVFGKFSLILSTFTMFSSVAGFALGTTSTRYLAKYRQMERQYSARIVVLTLLVAVAVGFICFCSIFFTRDIIEACIFRMENMSWCIAIIGIMLFLHSIYGAMFGILMGLEAFRKIALIYIILGVLDVTMKVSLTWFYGYWGAVYGMLLYVISETVLLCILSVRELRKSGIYIKDGLNGFWKEWRILTEFTLPSALESLMVVPLLWFCKASILWYPQGLFQYGLYSVLLTWNMLIFFIPSLLSSTLLAVMSSIISQGWNSKLKKSLGKLFLMLLLGLTLLNIFAYFFAPFILRLYSEAYEPYAAAFSFAILDASFLAINILLNRSLYVFGKVWSVCFIQIFMGILFASFVYIWAKSGAYGIFLGGCIAHCIGTIIYVAIVVSFFHKNLSVTR